MAPTKVLGRQRQIVLVTGTAICCLLLANASMLLRCSPEKIQVVRTMEKVSSHLSSWRAAVVRNSINLAFLQEWVLPAGSRNATAVRVLVMQTCGPGKYEELLRATRLANERWAGQQGYDYLSVVGVYAGGLEKLSTFNKAFMVAEVLNMSRYDYVFYMDADAMVTDPLWIFSNPKT